MTDRKRLGILIILLVVLGVTLTMAWRTDRPANAGAVDAVSAGGSPATQSDTEARIRLDLLARGPVAEEVGRQNLFQYRTRRTPETPASPFGPTPGDDVPLEPAPPTRPMPPPPPPPIPLKYEGYAEVNANSGLLRAFLSDSQSRFTVMTGEVIMGRYRILRITESSVEVEDLESNRRQTLPLLKPTS